MSKINIKCTWCGEELEDIGEECGEWPGKYDFENNPRWCRFQYGKDSHNLTPWFCNSTHMIEWLEAKEG